MHAWTFRSRFRRAAFGWKGSKLAIGRIHEALAEIRAALKRDAAEAAEGAVLFRWRRHLALRDQIDPTIAAISTVMVLVTTLMFVLVQVVGRGNNEAQGDAR
jgi:hypothetical protein